ncbi:Uncharacterised protein [Mycobacteroides abscessus subsp. abscessus]|nr:hypothetical protein PROPHIGD102-2_43 [Mycobacterium phage prophi102-2]QSM04017.1 hypothetical protein PROPHIGD54-1_43 [Mycobacterium phage prophiGD54-1]CPS02183.1 Hypothetical protein ERS075494_03600 [Mycobacteroides abscessus]SIG27765.1 Uncharacterised protein [Mycobacteroides abscessus subsp. abscessus]CPZ84827.1 Hypothetical protein ERS075653_02962 [Mycobacteroides abscessus]
MPIRLDSSSIERVFDTRLRAALADFIAGIPDLLSTAAVEKFTQERHEITYSPREVAERIAAVLPAGMRERGYELLELPAVERDQHGTYSVHVPLTGRPWAPAEIRMRRTPEGDQVTIVGTTLPLATDDVPAIAAGLLAARAFCASHKLG